MGQVYCARDERLERGVAIKLLPSQYAQEAERLKRFEREARLAGSLSHPNVLGVYDVGEYKGRPFIVTELLEGETLRDRLRGRSLSPARALEIGRQILDGLSAAHARGIIHRDLKPSNIFLCEAGPVKILDFGVAKLVRRDPGTGDPITGWTTEALPGTVGYLAPEQAHGHRVDHRADIFAFGCVLYETLSGRKAFPGATPAEVLVATLSSEPPELDRVAADVPRSLCRVVQCCLQKQPDDRYSAVHDVRLALDAAEEQMGRLGWVPRVHFRPRIRRAMALALAGLAVLAVGWEAVRRQGTSPLPDFRPRPVTSGAALEEQPAISPDGGFVAYSAMEAGNADIWLTDVRGGNVLRLTTDEAADTDPSWFPDGTSLAFVSTRGGKPGIWKVPRLGGQPTSLVPRARDPAVSPDGTRIAFARRGETGYLRIAVASLSDPQTARFLTAREHGLWDHEAPSWSPDGRTICYHDQNDLWLVDVEGGPPRRLASEGEADVHPSWSPDGRFLYISSIREGIRAIWRQPVRGGPAERVTMGPEQKWPSVARDGTKMAYATVLEETLLAVTDTRTGRRAVFEQAAFIGTPAVAPDGGSVVFVSDREGSVDLWQLGLEGGEVVGPPRRVTEERGKSSWPAFSPDGLWIAYYRVIDGQRDVWTVPAAGGASVAFTRSPAVDVSPVWSPDGSRLAFISDRSGVDAVWVAPVRDGKAAGEPRPLSGALNPVRGFAWSPDGTTLACVSPADGVDEIWLVPTEGPREPRRLTRGADVLDLRWPPKDGRLIALARWGGSVYGLRTVDPRSGEVGLLAPAPGDGSLPEVSDFDISPDGRWLAVVERRTHGDVWLLEATSGHF
jgi:Tol biopolymer transport system component